MCRYSFFLVLLSGLILLAGGCRTGSDKAIKPPAVQLTEKKFEKNESEPAKKPVEIKDLPKKPKAEKNIPVKTAAPPKKEKKAAPKQEVSVKHLNINDVVVPGEDGSRFLGKTSFVTRWNLLGPFDYDPGKFLLNGTKSVLHYSFFNKEKDLTGAEKVSRKGVSWQLVRFKSDKSPGEIDLNRVYKVKDKHCAAYAVTYLNCSMTLNDLILYAGSSGYLKIWINHKLVHAYDRGPRVGRWDQDAVHGIKLRKGYNLVVVKCVAVDGLWNFFFRLADKKDVPLQFIPQD
jgi:hypothetical protein